MSNENTISDTIERWLDGTLPSGEARAFEARMVEDVDLREKVEQHRRARAEIEEAVFLDFKRKAADWRGNLDNLPDLPPEIADWGSRRPSWKIWTTIAMLLLVLLAGAFWFLQKQDVELPETAPNQQLQPLLPDKPVAETEQPTTPLPDEKPKVGSPSPATERMPSDLLAMADEMEKDWHGSLESDMKDFLKNPVRSGQSQASNAEFQAASDAFLKGDFPAAKQLLLPMAAPGNPNAATACKMLADISYRELNFSAAAKYFETYAKTTSDPHAEWQLLHFYLRDYSNHKAGFWRLLNSIAGEEHRHQAEAKSLKEELEKAGLRE